MEVDNVYYLKWPQTNPQKILHFPLPPSQHRDTKQFVVIATTMGVSFLSISSLPSLHPLLGSHYPKTTTTTHQPRFVSVWFSSLCRMHYNVLKQLYNIVQMYIVRCPFVVLKSKQMLVMKKNNSSIGNEGTFLNALGWLLVW